MPNAYANISSLDPFKELFNNLSFWVDMYSKETTHEHRNKTY